MPTRTRNQHKHIKKIGLLSDTHGYWDDRYPRFFSGCDEIWHAGDIGAGGQIIEKLSETAPVRTVYGNIDDQDARLRYKKEEIFTIEDVKVFMTHIGGYPGRYANGIAGKLRDNHIRLFISGHSHILKVLFDRNLNLLHINPGAAGRYGFHTVRTLVRFDIDGSEIKNLEIYEIPLHEKK